jgi:glycosyltransferase involved in cell wall biosynthesis
MRKKIAIVFFEGFISVSPTLLNLSQYLSEKGFDIEIITREIDKNAYAPEYTLNNVNIVRIKYAPSDSLLVRIKNKIAFEIFSDDCYKKYCDYRYKQTVISTFEHHLEKNNYDFIIGVDTLGLIAASKVAFRRGKKLIYLSLEIDFLANKNNYFNMLFKKREIRAHKKSYLTVTQDEIRLDSLIKENKLDKNRLKYCFLPNAPRPLIDSNNDRSYFRNLFSLNKDDFIVLAAGMIDDAVMSYEIAEQCSLQNDMYKLIFHEREKIDLSKNKYVVQTRDIGGSNFYLSLNPLPYNEIDKIYCGADIGIAIYNPSYGENFKNIANASGKLTHYLKFGIPVIVNELPGMRDVIEKHQCGIVIDNINEFNLAVQKIKEQYEYYSRNALTCYNKKYNFDSHCEKIIEAIG